MVGPPRARTRRTRPTIAATFITSDADGLRLDTNGVTSNSVVKRIRPVRGVPRALGHPEKRPVEPRRARIEGKVSVHWRRGRAQDRRHGGDLRMA